MSRIRRLTSSLSGSIERLLDNFGEGQIGKLALRGDAFAFRARGDPRQLVAGLFLVGLGEQFAEIGERQIARA